MKKRCIGCGEPTVRCDKNSIAFVHSAPCPWNIAFNDAQLGAADNSLSGCIAHADAHWRKYWNPKIYDFATVVHGKARIQVFQICSMDMAQGQVLYCDKIGARHALCDISPAWPDEIEIYRADFLRESMDGPMIYHPVIESAVMDEIASGKTFNLLTGESIELGPKQSAREFFEEKMRPAGWPKPWMIGAPAVKFKLQEPCPCCMNGYKCFPIIARSENRETRVDCPECGGRGMQEVKL